MIFIVIIIVAVKKDLTFGNICHTICYMKRINYLNNRDILKEIHKSKTSFCWYTDPKYHNYDLIFDKPIGKLTKKLIMEARKNRVERLNSLKCEELGVTKAKLKDEYKLKLRDVKDTDVVVRVYTFEHIPDDLDRKANPKTVADTKVKLNFIPFKHYVLGENGEWQEVGKSHHAGHNQFSLTHGKITNKLALMFMKLCQRYGSRGNWRGYTYNDEMQAQALLQLSQIGLQFDEAKSANPFAYYTAAITNSFTRILNVEKKHQSLRDDLLQESGQNPSYTRQLEHEMKTKEEFGLNINSFSSKRLDKNKQK
jgi:hypothetical protein